MDADVAEQEAERRRLTVKEEPDKVEANRSHTLGYFAGKLTEAYKDAGRRFQSTREVLRNVQVPEMKTFLSQYVTMIPLTRRLHVNPQSEAPTLTANKVQLVNLSKDLNLGPLLDRSASVCPALPASPEGSVSCLGDAQPEVFEQPLLPALPPALARLQTCAPRDMLEKLECLEDHRQSDRLLSVFWVKTADSKQPLPKPGCLLLLEKDIVVVSTTAESDDKLAVCRRIPLMEVREVQVGLAGQHVRLIGSTEDSVLAVWTYSKEVTQDFCKAVLRTLAPEGLSGWTEGHPLLRGDLMALSLDWTARVPDISLDHGPHFTTRFKRVLADLLYIVHGNMSGPDKPSLAHVCPLLYASVRLRNPPPGVRGDPIFQLLLTDTHLALLQEDGVFHPAPRGSSLVPVQPQFQGVRLARRSDIRCLLVKQSGGCLQVELVFEHQAPAQGGRREERRWQGAAVDPSDQPRHSWKLCFARSSEAAVLIRQLCGEVQHLQTT